MGVGKEKIIKGTYQGWGRVPAILKGLLLKARPGCSDTGDGGWGIESDIKGGDSY